MLPVAAAFKAVLLVLSVPQRWVFPGVPKSCVMPASLVKPNALWLESNTQRSCRETPEEYRGYSSSSVVPPVIPGECLASLSLLFPSCVCLYLAVLPKLGQTRIIWMLLPCQAIMMPTIMFMAYQHSAGQKSELLEHGRGDASSPKYRRT